MDREIFEKLLAKKLFDTLSKDELAQFDALMRQNPEWGYEYECIHNFSKENIQEDTANIDQEWQVHQEKYKNILTGNDEILHNGRKKKYAAIVAVFCILLPLILLIVKFSGNHTNEKLGAISAFVSYQTGNEEHKRIVLPDSTLIILNANSFIQIDSSSFNKTDRLVTFYGEGYFEVAKNAKKPFYVKMSGSCIRVLGTAFNVKNYKGSNLIETSLLRGKIELVLNKYPDKKFILNPNEKIAVELPKTNTKGIAKAKPIIKETGIDKITDGVRELIQDTVWKQNRLAFSDRSLYSLVLDIGNKYGKTIIIKDSNVGEYHYSGIIPDISLEKTLDALSSIQPFKYEISSKYVIIYQ